MIHLADQAAFDTAPVQLIAQDPLIGDILGDARPRHAGGSPRIAFGFMTAAPDPLDRLEPAMAAKLDGPRLGPRKGARHLIVLLHGYGADGQDLIELGAQWRAALPDAAIVAPNAPEPCAGAPMGRQWFPLTMRDPEERWTGVNKAGPVLDAFLDAELAAQGLDDSKLALIGFSQGTMMALHVGLRRRRAPAAIIGFSGLLVGGEHLAALARPAAPPPILLTHGSADDVIPAAALFMAGEELVAAGIPVQWHLSVGVGHGIDEAALHHAGLFLLRHFGARPLPGLTPA